MGPEPGERGHWGGPQGQLVGRGGEETRPLRYCPAPSVLAMEGGRYFLFGTWRVREPEVRPLQQEALRT